MQISKDFFSGARAAAPILLGVVPFALVCGVGAISVGLTPFESVGMSLIVFAGASQLAVFQMLGAGSPWLIMVLTSWVINLRFSMYSASLAPALQNRSTWQKALLAYMLSDQAFGISTSYFAQGVPVNQGWFYFGAAATVWVTWQIGAIAGALLGTLVPASWGFDFAFPLSFLALMFGALRDRPSVVAALTGGLVAVAAKGWPSNLGLVSASALGIAAGVLAEWLKERREVAQ
jgi:4-azaleucine resistance transporter AzlC